MLQPQPPATGGQQQQQVQPQPPVPQSPTPQQQQQPPAQTQPQQMQAAQNQQLQQQRLQQEQMRQQQLQQLQKQQQLRLQQQQQQQQLQQQQQQQQQQTPGPPANFEPPQQIVGQNRFPSPGSFPHSQAGGGMLGARVPGHPPATAGLRLNIPQQQLGSAPSSALPSPALTPRSEGEDMETGSSRGPTPGSDRMDGAITPDMMDPNKVLKRRPSMQQQKRRPRKGSRADDGDYDNYIDSVMHQLKNLPPMSTVEPKLSHSFNACSIYGTGEVPKLMSKEIDLTKGTLDGKYGSANIPSEGDYYSTMPFGHEPPVPFIP